MGLEKIVIKNFRAIEELELELGRINIIVGRNNTGKTSVLEAIILFLASMYDGFKDPIFNKNMLKYISQLHGGFNSLFRSDENQIVISSVNSSGKILELKIVSGKTISSLKDDEIAALKQELLLPIAKKTTKERILSLEREIEELERLKAGRGIESVRIRSPSIVRKVERLNKYREELAYLKENFEPYTYNLADSLLYDSTIIAAILTENSSILRTHIVLRREYAEPEYISSAGVEGLRPILFYYRLDKAYPKLLESLDVVKKIEVIEELRSKIPYFVDYRDGMIIFGYESDRREKEVIPLDGASDGVKVLMELFPLGMLGIKVALLEESETHLHPGFMKRFAEEAVSMAKKTGIQLIMTSHSIEFIEILLEYIKKEGYLDEMRIIRMYRLPSGEIDREILRGEEAIEELEVIKGDLRGP